jgi:hypothetical protein
MSNQVYSNSTTKYPIDGSDIEVNGNSLDFYLDQAVKTTSSPTFNSITSTNSITATNSVTSPVIQSAGSITLSPGNQMPVELLRSPSSDNQPRILQNYFKGTIVGTAGISTTISNLIQLAGTITIQVQFVSIGGSFPGQYGSYRQTTRYINNLGTITFGSNLENLLQRDTNVATASISLSTPIPNTITTTFFGVAGETIIVSGTVTIFQ